MRVFTAAARQVSLTPAIEDPNMWDDAPPNDADARTALLLLQVLILALIESRVVDGEAFRRIADDVLMADVNLDPAVMTQVILRLNSVIQDSYAVHPTNTSLPEPDADGPGSGPLA